MDLTMLRIFPAKKNKRVQTIRQLFVEYADSLGFDLGFQDFEEELANLPGKYAPPTGCILLAEYDGKIVGCVALRKLSDNICEGKRLYVRPQFRGLKIGKKLMEAIIEEARKIGYTHMRGDTLATMKTAWALYESLGFKEIEPYYYNPIEGAKFIELKLV
jgi:ribosomal protein S18 acetylase RimI-like enzyme